MSLNRRTFTRFALGGLAAAVLATGFSNPALAGAWFETLKVMAAQDAKGKAARTEMAKLSGTDLPGYEAQLKTTKLFYTPAETLAFTASPQMVTITDSVRKFSFDHGLLGQGAPNVNVIGIQFADGKVLGNAKNVKLRYDTSILKLAVEGKL